MTQQTGTPRSRLRGQAEAVRKDPHGHGAFTPPRCPACGYHFRDLMRHLLFAHGERTVLVLP